MTPRRAAVLLLGAPLAGYSLASVLTHVIASAYWQRKNVPEPTSNPPTWGGSLLGGVPKVATPTPPDECSLCRYHAARLAHAEAQALTANARIATLEAENDTLLSRLNVQPATERDFAAVQARMYQLAREETAARDALAEQTERILEIAAERDREKRIAENLRTRLRAAGVDL